MWLRSLTHQYRWYHQPEPHKCRRYHQPEPHTRWRYHQPEPHTRWRYHQPEPHTRDDTINQSLTHAGDTNADHQSLVQTVGTQTNKIRVCDANTQVSSIQPQQQIHVPAPVLCYVPVESQSRHDKFGCEIIKENDATKFYTGLASWSLSVSFLIPNHLFSKHEVIPDEASTLW